MGLVLSLFWRAKNFLISSVKIIVEAAETTISHSFRLRGVVCKNFWNRG